MKKGTFTTLTLLAFAAGFFTPDVFPADSSAAKPEKERKLAAPSKRTAKAKQTAKAQEAAKARPASKSGATEAAETNPKAQQATPLPAEEEAIASEQTTAQPESQQEESALPAHPWADSAAREKELAESIRRQFKGSGKEAVQAFLSSPDNRLLLTQWQLAHTDNTLDQSKQEERHAWTRQRISRLQHEVEELQGQQSTSSGDMQEYSRQKLEEKQAALRDLELELASPYSMKEALADPATVEVFQKIVNDADWMEQLFYSGECVNPGRTIAIIAALAKEDPSVLSKRMPRAIATATALEWAKSNWDFALAVERARFYIDNDRDNRFNNDFRKLPLWQLRTICGCKSKTDDSRGSLASLRWALDNVHLPAEQYTGACWQADYQLNNLFNDSVHGSEYYAVYDDVYGDNGMQRTRDVGGVCGSLSHYGAFAALANGVPALPAGEPGHCAYIVWVNGKWVPAYSLSWERGLHWQVWKDVHVYSSLHMATELYGEAQKEQTALSNASRILGRVFANADMLRQAVETQPCNHPAWRDYADLLKEHHASDAKAWTQLNQDLCKRLVPRYPEMAAELLRNRVYPNLQFMTDKQLESIFNTFWKAVGGMGPDRWAVEALANAQLALLQEKLGSADPAAGEQLAIQLYELIINATSKKSAYAPVALAWGNSVAAEMGDEMQKQFLKSTMSALNKGGKGSKDGSRDRMLGQAMLGAEEMRDLNAFQAIGKCLSSKYRQPKEKLPEWEAFPGKLVSQGGLLYTSSTSEHDDPAAHWGVLEPTGGRFHTDKDSDAWAVVQLPRPANITGVVTIAPNGNLGRLSGMKVQYSESGEDGDWHDAGALPSPTEQRVNRLDLQGTKPRARFIRILRPGGPELFHLNAIFVYGRPAA